MGLSPDTERAIQLCYDAIATPGQWTSALDDLAHSIGARACMILPHEISDRNRGVVGSTEMQKLHELCQRNLDWLKPVYEPRGDPFVRRGYQAVLQSQLFTDDEVRHSRFHQEISRPAGMQQWACGIFTAEGRYWCMPFFRGSEPFLPEHLEPIAEIALRVARIVSIAEKVSRTGAENEVLALDRVGCAAVLVDGRGRVKRINRGAEDLLCDEFGIRNGRLWAASSASLARLNCFIAEIEQAGLGARPLPAPVIIARHGTPWLLIEALPVALTWSDAFDGCRAILVLSDLTRRPISDATLLSLVFGLTHAEARLAAAICEGHDLNTAAASFGVSCQTVRSQLKTIFAKTGSRRQAELVARAAQIRNTARH